MKPTFKKQLLVQNVQMDGSINFQANGDINVYPCPWESDKEVANGNRVRYRAGIEVDADGRTRVKRVNDGSKGPKYLTIFETAHAVKGVCGNLGLTNLSALASEITEEFRPGSSRKLSDDEVREKLDAFAAAYRKAQDGIAQYAESVQ